MDDGHVTLTSDARALRTLAAELERAPGLTVSPGGKLSGTLPCGHDVSHVQSDVCWMCYQLKPTATPTRRAGAQHGDTAHGSGGDQDASAPAEAPGSALGAAPAPPPGDAPLTTTEMAERLTSNEAWDGHVAVRWGFEVARAYLALVATPPPGDAEELAVMIERLDTGECGHRNWIATRIRSLGAELARERERGEGLQERADGLEQERATWRELAEKAEYSARQLCGSHRGVPFSKCPQCWGEAAVQRATQAERELAEARQEQVALHLLADADASQHWSTRALRAEAKNEQSKGILKRMLKEMKELWGDGMTA